MSTNQLLAALQQKGVVWRAAAEVAAVSSKEQLLALAGEDVALNAARATNPESGEATSPLFPPTLCCGATHEFIADHGGATSQPTAPQATAMCRGFPVRRSTATEKRGPGKRQRSSNATPPPLTVIAGMLYSALENSATAHQDATTDPRYILWIGRESWPTPFLIAKMLAQDLQRSLFIEVADETQRLWTVDLALRSIAAKAVITSFEKLRFNLTQRFSLAAKHSGALGIFIRSGNDIDAPTAAHTRWVVTPHRSTPERTTTVATPRWNLELRRNKGAQTAQRSWVVGCERIYGEHNVPLQQQNPLSEAAALRLCVPSELVDRSRAASAPQSEAASASTNAKRFAFG